MRPPPLAIACAEDRVVLERANFILRHFVPGRRRRGLPVLVVAPMSGHFGWLMADTLAGLAAAHDVLLLEWKDAGDIPPAAGRLGFDAPILAVMECLRLLGPGVTVLGVSQAPTTILAAAALMAAQREPERPKALVLMGGFLDPRISPTTIEQMAARLPPGWFTRTMATNVPANEPGCGRRIYPAAAHRHALNRYLARHMAARGELYHKAQEDPDFLEKYLTLMDLPAEFAEENSRWVFAEARLAQGLLACRGRAVEPATITDIALLTVEGGADDSSGAGQTHVAHDLCRNISAGLRARWTEPASGHFGLFLGEPWRSSVLPRVSEFIDRMGRPAHDSEHGRA